MKKTRNILVVVLLIISAFISLFFTENLHTDMNNNYHKYLYADTTIETSEDDIVEVPEETFPFLDEDSEDSKSNTGSSEVKDNKNTVKKNIIIVLLSVLGVSAISVSAYFIIKKLKTKNYESFDL